jgi:hypothetical protein
VVFVCGVEAGQPGFIFRELKGQLLNGDGLTYRDPDGVSVLGQGGKE